ncbi:hypothetical protein P154DRAFT_248381 [Amniculicola lignicola CBS 123094]|uniref:Transcription factor BYE1 n=1 Tax=Amniculicola lignicola CBS 123094 TaxID=1392246 RepID=A0A6A5W9F7_9PLEO|nr:hypothetical protein P154DRAFT_248381 [Amniculicola lignicola CBS 123094]
MSEEIRRSGRANKGHHTLNRDLDDIVAPPSKPKTKGKSDKSDKKGSQAGTARSQSVQTPEKDDGDEDDAIIRCVCGDQRDIRGRQMICCDDCEAWQHVKCLGLDEGPHWNTDPYRCERCNPEGHVTLLAAMARGEKPWSRKKGSKGKTKSARPSEVKAEDDSAKESVSSPQQTPARVSPPPPKAAPPKAPAPQETPQDPPTEPQNGHAEPQKVPKSQPQSPVGEKRRRDTIAEKEGSQAKRRKSSAVHHDKPPQDYVMATDPGALPDRQRGIVEKIIQALAPQINEAASKRGFRIPDGDTPSSLATRLALQIDYHCVVRHGVPSNNESPYVLQTRSIIWNTKKNPGLADRLFSGAISPEVISTMVPEEMASEEKQREYAALREANEKQMVLTEETGPRLKKTHKGEEYVGHDNMDVDVEMPQGPRLSMHEERKPSQSETEDRDELQAAAEPPESTDGPKPLTVDTTASTPQAAPPSASTAPAQPFDINTIYAKVKSPTSEQQAFFHRRQSSFATAPKQTDGPIEDPDVDRLLRDDDNDVIMSDDPTIVWRGTLDMEHKGRFEGVARFVAGGDLGQVVPWAELLSPNLPVVGKIDSQKGNEYIRGLATNGAYDVGVLAITPVTQTDREEMDNIYQYFQPRDRWGVIPVERLGNAAMRDLYVIPVEAGGSNLPGFLDMLEYCTIETPRPHDMIVLALIVKLPENRSQPHYPPTQHFAQFPAGDLAAGQMAATPQPNGAPVAPSPLSANPHGPQYSPLQSAFPNTPTPNTDAQRWPDPSQPPQPFPPQPQQQLPYQPAPPAQMQSSVPHPHQQYPKAVEILGAFIDAPVMKQFATFLPNMPDDILRNLRHILEVVPAARDEIGILQQHLTQTVGRGEGK